MSDRMLSDEVLLGLIKANSGGGGGTSDYDQLSNKPQIGSVTLSGNKSASDLSLASLDSNGKVPASQLPSYVDDVINGYLHDGKFYEDDQYTTEISGEDGKIYVDLATNKTYRWSGLAFVEISESLALGETSSTAYAGNKGKANADAITAILDGQSIDSFGDVETALAGKQNTLTFDDVPTDNSNNPVKSNGVYDALSGKANQSQLATVEESTTASKAYSAGEYLVLGGVLYKVTANIAQGGTIVTEGAGKNVDLATVGGELSAINSNLTSFEENKGVHTSCGVWSSVTYGTSRLFVPFYRADLRTITVNSAYMYETNAMTDITESVTITKIDSGFEVKTTEQNAVGKYGSVTYTVS